MTLKTKVTRKITDIPREDWEGVFPDILEGYDFYKTLDESRFEQFSFYYIVVYDNNSAVAAAPCFSMRYSLDTSVNGTARRVFNYTKKFIPNVFSVKALICGMPMGKGRIGMVKGKEDKKIVDAIFRKMEEIAKDERIKLIAFKDFSHSYTNAFEALVENGFFKVDGLPYAEKALTFKTFEDYLKTLSSATRYDLRRKFKKVDGNIKIEMEIVDELKDDALLDVYRLYLQMLEKHEMIFEIVPIAFFKNMPKNMPGKAKVFLWRIDNKIVAFLFCMVSGDVIMDYFLGLDYAVAHKYHLYFIKHRDVINWCIDNGIKRYAMGFSGYEAKRRLGFDFIPLRIYIKHRNRIMNQIFKLLLHFLKFENFDPDVKSIKRSLSEKRTSDSQSIRHDLSY